jgi:hypothetical protein
MAKQYFTKKGFAGLTHQGKLFDLIIGAASFLISYIIFDGNIILSIIIATIAAMIAINFLPRSTYYRVINKYYCADCGQFVGYSPEVCPRCGCNRYTTNDSGVGRTFRNR